MKRTLVFFVLAAIVLLLTPMPALAQTQISPELDPQAWLRDVLQWIDGLGAAGPVAFILLYSVATVAFLPGSLLTLGAGVVFGVVQGSVCALLGASLGATLAFLVGRYLARDWVTQRIAGNAGFRAIDAAVGREGFKIVLLTRLSPIFPFALLNYGFGVTSVSLRDYVLGCVGMIPATMLYVYLGSLAGNLAAVGTTGQPGNPAVQWGFRILGLLFTVAATLYITRVARRALSASIGSDEISEKQVS